MTVRVEELEENDEWGKGRRRGEGFWTAKEMRQRCPLSPLLLNLLMADLETKMGGSEITREMNIYASISR